MSIEALKEAKSVIGSINSGKANALTIGGETVYWQRKEWVRWALDEVLPLIEQAIAEAEKQRPVAQCMEHGECFGGKCIYPHPQPKREPLTVEQLREHWQVAKVLDMTNAEIDFADYVLIARDVEALYGIKEKNT